MQDQTAYQEDGPDFEPQDNEAFEISLKKSTSMPLDSTKKRKTERQKKDDEELLILRSLAASVKEEDDMKKSSKETASPTAAFGNYVSQALSFMDERTRLMAMNNIQNAIFQAQMSCCPGGMFSSQQPLVGPVGQTWTHRDMLDNTRNGESNSFCEQ